jgi:hypothetical protein
MSFDIPTHDEQAFAVSQAVIWPSATLSATFLWLFRGWLFVWVVWLPMIFVVYRNLWTLLGLTLCVALLAGVQQAFEVHWGDLKRGVRRWVNPRRIVTCRPPPRWPKDG